MRATLMRQAGDVRIQDVPDAAIAEPADAVVRVAPTCICGSDLWPYKQLGPVEGGQRMGLEPGRVLDRTVDLGGVRDGYRAMNDREAIEVMIRPS